MKLNKTIFLVLFFILTTVSVLAQPSVPGDGDDGQVTDVAPIDDHLWVILLLGLGLGIYFILTKESNFSK